MWAGTNAGYVFIYQIHLPSDDRRHTDTVDCILGEYSRLFPSNSLVLSLSISVLTAIFQVNLS